MLVEMTRKKLKQYRALKKEIAGLEKAIDKLYDQEMDIPVVLGKVTGSGRDFPYILEHVTVQMDEPKKADAISERIKIKEQRKEVCEKLTVEIEQFISNIPDSTDRQIFEMVFLEGMKQREAAEAVNYTQARVSQRISSVLKDLYNL